MKPAPFRYFAPDSLDAARELMGTYGLDAKLLAGGQSLIPALNFRCWKPGYVVDLNMLDELDYIRMDADGNLYIGAMTRYRTLEFDPLIATHFPLLHHAIPYIAHTAIRTRGTVGGSLSYADPAAELPAVTMALGAQYRVVSPDGERWIEADSFFQNMFKTALKPEEILVEVMIPALPPGTAWAFHEVARRHGDRVMTGIAAVVTCDDDGACRQANLVYINAARTPVRASRAIQILSGGYGTASEIESVADMVAREEVDPEDDVHATASYRRHLAAELTRRALTDIFSALRKDRQAS